MPAHTTQVANALGSAYWEPSDGGHPIGLAEFLIDRRRPAETEPLREGLEAHGRLEEVGNRG